MTKTIRAKGDPLYFRMIMKQGQAESSKKKHAFKCALFSLNAKILFLAAGVACMTTILISTYYYNAIAKITLEKEIDALSFETRMMVPKLQSVFDALRNDVDTLSRMPPIQGIIRSTRHNDIDPLDGSTTALWKKRLSIIFAAMIDTKDYYAQIRLVGLTSHGRELVRVNRNGDSIEVVPEDTLQSKGDEPYFKAALNLKPGTIYFSVVSLNRENGQVVEPYMPVLRTIIPIFDDQQKLFGMVVINAAYNQMLKGILKKMRGAEDLYIINEDGGYVSYSQNNQNFEFQYGVEDNKSKNALVDMVINSHKNDETVFKYIEGVNYAIHYRKLFFDPENKNRFLGLAIRIPKNVLLESAYKTRQDSLLLGIGLLFISVLCAWCLASFIRRPLRKITNAVRHYEDGNVHIVDLPTKRTDEIGEFARAFEGLTQSLDQSRDAEKKTLSRLQAILDGTLDGLITINDYGVVHHYNKACERIFGYQPCEVIGQNIKMLMPDPYHSGHDGYLKNHRETGEKKIIGIGREVQAKRKDGRVFPIDLSVSEVGIKGEKLYSGIIRDITDRRKAEDEIMRSNEELERFAYIASHDLQEPLRMVSNFTMLLNEDYSDTMDDQAKHYMKFITEAATRMQSLISDLLDYSRVGTEDVGYRDFDSAAQIDNVLQNLNDTITQTNAHITVGHLPHIYCNSVRFSRLMQNLIGNAIKYRIKDKRPEIYIDTDEKDDEWVFSVRDNGLGIKNEYLEQIFIIFKRLHHKQEYSGTGIGLSVCKKIVENFGGRIWAESDFGKGSVFFFTVPKRKKEESE